MTNNNIYFVANWKMFGLKSSINKIDKVINLTKKNTFKKINIIYCPPTTILSIFANKLRNSKIKIGAQNIFYTENFGPHTGSVNAKMIKDSGASYVILGHSENRNEGETDLVINKKIKVALKEKIKVIFCFGETLRDRNNKKTSNVLKKQILNALKGINDIKNIIFAYEPVWSIGTGKVLKSENLFKDIEKIKGIIRTNFNIKEINILYGGSVNTKNIMDLKKVDNLSGFLIGGASQNQNKFIDIIKKTFY